MAVQWWIRRIICEEFCGPTDGQLCSVWMKLSGGFKSWKVVHFFRLEGVSFIYWPLAFEVKCLKDHEWNETKRNHPAVKKKVKKEGDRKPQRFPFSEATLKGGNRFPESAPTESPKANRRQSQTFQQGKLRDEIIRIRQMGPYYTL